MNLLSVENITKTFGERMIFENLTFGINQGEKVALVAKNGSGKTTLLRCLIGKEPLDSGRVIFRNGIVVAFLQQAEELNPDNTVFEEVLHHDLPKLKVFKEYAKAVKESDENKITDLFDKMSQLNAWNMDNLVEQILHQLKLENYDAKISTLSGGQKKRVALAKVLLSEPDFLFLDEPTNHLDLDMIEWLESYLSQSNSTIFMVTHDRYFLEVVCDVIYELEDLKLHRYKGNFSYYLEKKAEREENLNTEVSKAKSQFKKELEWIRRQPKARGTKQKARIEAFEATKETASQNLKKETLEINVKMERLGTKILEFHNITKSFGKKRILNKFSYTFKRNERLGIVGANGVGKSTFLKMIMGKENPDTGKVIIGDTVVFGYYSQENIKVNDNKRVIEEITEIAEFIPLEKGREMSATQFLERFLFPRSRHYDYVYKLSGGEKRRLKLMKILMKNPNFLILDEPTNDLDIYILGVLEEYLRHFQGCLIVVSHDRYFMDKMVDHIFVFKGDGELEDILGNYTEYRKYQQLLVSEAKQEKKEEKLMISKNKEELTKKKLSYKEQQEFNQLESEIITLEIKKEELTAKLYSGTADTEVLNETSKELNVLLSALNEKTERWMYLADFI